MTDSWKIHPGKGMGRLRFGLPRKEVEALARIYGEVQAVVDEESATQSVIDTMQSAASKDRSIFELTVRMREQSRGLVSESRGVGAPLLRYRYNLLSEIVLEWSCESAHVNNILVLPLELSGIVRLADPGNVKYEGNSIVIAEMGIEFVNYYKETGSDDLVEEEDRETRIVNLFPTNSLPMDLNSYHPLGTASIP